MAFLVREAFRSPIFLADPAVTRRFEASGTVHNITQLQSGVLSALLKPLRLVQLEQQEMDAGDGKDVFTVREMLTMLRIAIWEELDTRPVRIDRYRQELQWEHIRTLKSLADEPGSRRHNRVSAYVRALAVTELAMIKSDIEQAIRKSKDGATARHYKRLLAEL